MSAPALDLPAFPPKSAALPKRDVWRSIRRGFARRCPACGEGRIFAGYVKVNASCPHCAEELHHHRADDAPPYMTILVVGHIIGTMMLLVEDFWPDAPIWLHALFWPTLTLMLSLWFLPRMKGALISLQWALRMHGFEDPKAPTIPGF